MTLTPKFTTDEEFLIKFVKSPTAGMQSNSYMWSYILGGMALAGFAAYYENVWMLLSAFIVVCGFRIYEEWYQRRWLPLWGSIINKYEAALIDPKTE